MALLLSLEALGRRNMASSLLLLDLALYVSMLGLASWALNSFVHDIYIGDHKYYPPADDDACMCTGMPNAAGAAPPRSAGDEATLHFVQAALLAAVLGSAAKAAAALGTVAWAATATALAHGLACNKEMRGWQMRALEAVTATLAVTQLAYVIMLHRAAAAADSEAEVDADAADADAYAAAGDQCEPGCSTTVVTEADDDIDCQHAQLQQEQHGQHQHRAAATADDSDADADADAGDQCDPGCSTTVTAGDDDVDCQHAEQQQHGQHQHHHRQGQEGGGPSCSVM